MDPSLRWDDGIFWDDGAAGMTVGTTRSVQHRTVPRTRHARLTLEDDVHVGDNMKVAWFKDPDGNILSIVSG